MTYAIEGFCDPRFQSIEAVFRANLKDGYDIGASMAAYHEGQLVVDLWGGWKNRARTDPWTADTIVPVMSTTKIMGAICMFILIDRDKLALDATVASYWPEFAQGGKGEVTIRDVLTHQAGVPGFRVPAPHSIMSDWLAITARIAAEPHWFGGERQITYHPTTWGFLAGEIIRRVDGRGPAQFFKEEVADKMGADFQIGLSDRADLARYSAPIPALSDAPAESGNLDKILSSIGPPKGGYEHRGWESLSVENFAGNGIGNARGIAKACSIIANRGVVDGQRYLSEAIIAEAGKTQVYGQCPYLGWIRMGLILGLDSKEFPAPSATTMHWGGYGGSWAAMDPKVGFSFAFAQNHWIAPPHDAEQMSADLDPRGARLMAALTRILADLDHPS